MKVTVKINQDVIDENIEIAKRCLVKTADAVRTNLVQSETMPFDTGALQNRSTYVDDSEAEKGSVSVVSDTPYARRLYFHPEYNFQRIKNRYAGGKWFQPYIDGAKRDFIHNTFAKFLEKELKK